jgi:hypothetical protein
MFKRNLENPLETLNIGKITIIKKWLSKNCKSPSIDSFYFDDNLNINCNAYVDLAGIHLTEFPDYIQFNNVTYFDVSFNTSLNNTKGFPKKCDVIWINETKIAIEDIRKCCETTDIRKFTL